MTDRQSSYDPTETGVLRLSKSSFGTYSMCPKQYWWNYIAGLSAPPNDAMIRGTAIHAILEDALLNKQPVLTAASSHGHWFDDHGTHSMDELLRQFQSHGDYIFIEAEKKHEVPATINGRDVVLVGKIDGVFRMPSGQLLIVELKTGELGQSKVSRTKKELNFYRYMLGIDGYDITDCFYMVIAPDATNADVATKLANKRNTTVFIGELSGVAYIEKVHLGSYRKTVEKIEQAVEGIFNEEWPTKWSDYFCPEWCAFHLSCEQEILG